ncbi:2-C-methyl-D-erythritol 4-phosphate cytidylyltransferase [Sinobacterium norvegicum]|uniref:2-C-methyl-D-erythritol 4-phosphate cytidylyltransferase n=1 Tax=Sinobacterium norvegicum TaxID=1641715 RepID=A0ABM9ABW3_9GAMM|nr:2-C-methyl-D-erythritol 4-phosphate cytidylyltransferase [Sinobacterium norvegicum]CAH0990691.1 2-C-methyl-D-erythritol 4-phosphate cytidylyltransferase [Sinobacterium norvegicum]
MSHTLSDEHSSTMQGFWFVIPAAGVGSRFGAEIPKQYCKINGQTVIEHSISALLTFQPEASVLVAVAKGDHWWPSLAIASDPRVITVEGGDERADSVLNALIALQYRASYNDWVLVHDAARPCISQLSLGRLANQLAGNKVGGLLAVPVADTLKKAGDNQTVENTVDRRGLWAAQTPQMFRYGLLKQAMEQAVSAGEVITDEASAIEYSGEKSILVEGDGCNIKITRPADLSLAAYYLNRGEAE